MTNPNTTYKRLGDYIREVDVRNSDLSVSKLVGLTIAKAFIPSVANTIGTDLSKYKIIRENQFACSLMQVSRDGKMPIAIYKGENAIMSPAYPVFEVYKEGLLPDYLQMWFSRPEFDREAVFYAVGGVRGSLDWNDFMDMMLPVPPLEEQQRIVDRYNAIKNRIETNKQTIAKLEEAAQALYRKMFVDNIDPENLPEGWRMGTIKNLGEIITGKTPSTLDETNFGYDIPFLTIPDMHNIVFVTETERLLSLKGANSQKNKTIPPKSICVSCIGTPGLVVINTQPIQTNQQINSIVLKDTNCLYYSYFTLRNLKQIITEYGMGAAVLNNLNKMEFANLQVLVPCSETLKEYNTKVSSIFELLYQKQKENEKLTKILSVVMARM